MKQRIDAMTKKCRKNKAKPSGSDSDCEIILGTKTKSKFEDTKAITGITPEFKWGEIYHIIRD